MHVIALLAADPSPLNDYTPTKTLNAVRAIMVILLSLGFIAASISLIFGPAKHGNTRRVADVVGATLLALIPAAIGIGGLALGFGAAILHWAVPGMTS
jgi:hypothetical protein